MDDHQVEAIKAEIRRVEQTITAELKPLAQLFRGNGKPSLEARLFHMEKELARHKGNARWAIRSAVGAMATALGTVVWSLLQQGA